jgi:dephospho-CoA kinase
MQKLTDRGIRIAAKLRAQGVAVIESYPGAAQDILGIPRKRASQEMLAAGLSEFGIAGAYCEKQVSHDELDAITAAVVGAFFWAGRFESLGNGPEEALIIPDLSIDPKAWIGRRVIGFSGPIAAGKSTAAHHVAETLGFHYSRYSQVLEDFLAAGQDISPSRLSLQKWGSIIHSDYGQRWLNRRLFQTLPSEGNIVVDGLRFPDDHAFLREAYGPAFVHIHISAPFQVRDARFRIRAPDSPSLAEVQRSAVEQGVTELPALSDAQIYNVNTKARFLSEIERIVRSLWG